MQSVLRLGLGWGRDGESFVLFSTLALLLFSYFLFSPFCFFLASSYLSYAHQVLSLLRTVTRTAQLYHFHAEDSQCETAMHVKSCDCYSNTDSSAIPISMLRTHNVKQLCTSNLVIATVTQTAQLYQFPCWGPHTVKQLASYARQILWLLQ